MRKILVLRGGALGDFIVTLPTLALLRERWPDAQIELVGNATAAQLALARGWLDAVHSQHESRWGGLYRDGELPLEFAHWLSEFDLVISYWPDPDGALRGHFPRRPDQVFLAASAMPGRAPAAAHYCVLLEELGTSVAEIFREPRSRSPARKRRDHPAAHAAGYDSHPPREWIAAEELAERQLAQTNPPVACARVARSRRGGIRTMGIVPSAGLTVLTHPPLEDLVFHLSQCRLFVGHDSGVSHLAAACGARCLLLFGPTDPTMWAPPISTVRVLQAGSDLAAISVEAVEHAIAAALAGST